MKPIISLRTSSVAAVAFLGIALTAPAANAAVPQAVDTSSSDYKNFVQVAKESGATDDEIQKTAQAMEADSSITTNQVGATGTHVAAAKAHPDGCSDPIPALDDAVKFQFDGPCNLHDIRYSAEENNGRSRAQCDQEFRDNMDKVCKKGNPGQDPNVPSGLHACLLNEGAYYYAVRTFGRSQFKGSGDPG